MITGKKVLVLTTTDNMIWQFLIPHIRHLQEAGNTVECACNRSGFFFDDLKEKFGLTVHEIDFTRFPFTPKNFKARKQLIQLCKENKYDLIHCHQPVGGVMGRMIGKKFKIPVLYVAHGFHFFKGAPLKNNLIYKTIERHYAKFTDALVTMNEEDFTAAKKFKAKAVYKIPGIGLDLQKYSLIKKRNELKKELNISEKDIVFLSIGELNQNKNLETTIKAFSIVKNPNVKYLICGQGSLKEKFENIIKENNQTERIKLLGFRKDITEILNLSDVFVMPSFREGLPKSMMEAMAYGLPVICSDIRGCHDLIKRNQGGLLLSPDDVKGFANAMQKLSEKSAIRQNMGKINKENIKEYSIENVKNEMEKIYDKLFEKEITK